METGSHEIVIFSYATVCLHQSVSLNNEKNCRAISKNKIAVCEKTASLRSGNSLDLNSACLKALVSVEIFQFSDKHYESRFLDTFRGHNIRPNRVRVKNFFATMLFVTESLQLSCIQSISYGITVKNLHLQVIVL